MLYQLALLGPIEGVDSFSVLEWSLREGDLFEAGSLIVELEAEKAIIQLRAARAGSLRKILCRRRVASAGGPHRLDHRHRR